MARPRSFDEQQVVAAAGDLFARRGFAATSVDDLVKALGLHRGSLYQVFGSKRGLFLAALRRSVTADPAASTQRTAPTARPELDLVLVAALELAADDDDVRELVSLACRSIGQVSPQSSPAEVLGGRLLQRAGLPIPSSPRHVREA